MKCQLNREMLWPTNSQKQLFDNNMDSMAIHFRYSFQPVYFLQYRGLAHWTQRTVKGPFLEVYLGMNLKHCTIFEIRPEENLLPVKLTWSSFMSVP